MLSQFIFKITLCRIGLQLRQDVPDSGQEHPAHGNNSFLVAAASLDSAVPFPAFGIFVGFDDGICYLNQKRL